MNILNDVADGLRLFDFTVSKRHWWEIEEIGLPGEVFPSQPVMDMLRGGDTGIEGAEGSRLGMGSVDVHIGWWYMLKHVVFEFNGYKWWD